MEISHRWQDSCNKKILHSILLCSEVATNLIYVEIETSSLERRTCFVVEYSNTKKSSDINKPLQLSVADGAGIWNICKNARNQLNLPQLAQFTIN